MATILTLAFGGSVGKEGPCAQIGAAITSGFADFLRLTDEDRRRLVICGIGAGFAAVFGTPVSGALFGIEVLYLGRIEYGVLFPCLGMFAAFGFVAVVAAAANTPIAAAVMGMELLPTPLGVYGALCAGSAFLMVGHRSVYPSQRLGLAKSAGLEIPLHGPIGEIDRSGVRIRQNSLTDRTLRLRRHLRAGRLRRRKGPRGRPS